MTPNKVGVQLRPQMSSAPRPEIRPVAGDSGCAGGAGAATAYDNREALASLERLEAALLRTRETLWQVTAVTQIVFALAVSNAVLIDANRPERWGDWYRNPRYEIPFCAVVEAVMAMALVRGWRDNCRKLRGTATVRVGLQLLAEGRPEDADHCFRAGYALLGHRPPARTSARGR